MKRKFSMLLLLTMLLPLTSCNSLEGKEIEAGEMPRGGKEVTYQEVKQAMEEKENEQTLPNALRLSMSSDSIKYETSQYNTYVDGTKLDKVAVELNNLTSNIEVDGLVNAKSISELNAKASLSTNVKIDLDDLHISQNSTEVLELLNNTNISINSYITHSNLYLDMNDSTNYFVNSLIYGETTTQEIIPSKFYLDASLIFPNETFPLLSENNGNSDELLSIEIPGLEIDIPRISQEATDKLYTILCDEFVSIKKYKDEFIAVINLNGQMIDNSAEKIFKQLYDEGVLDELYDDAEPINQEQYTQYLGDFKEQLQLVKDDLKTLKITAKFDSKGVSEVYVDILYERQAKQSTDSSLEDNSGELIDLDYAIKYEYFDSLEIQFPEFDSSYESLLAKLGGLM